MAHTKSHDLKDIQEELNKIRELDALKEKSPGIFYYKSDGFLHFHDKDGKRWADIKVKGEWKELKINFHASKATRESFLANVKKYHKALLAK
jgi:hypothetical protein